MVIILGCFKIFAQDFSCINEGDTKDFVIKELGNPFSSVKEGKHEYSFWIDDNNIWVITFSNSIVDVKAQKLEDLFTSLLELKDSFSLDDYFSDNRFFDVDDNEYKIEESLIDNIEISILKCCVINKDYNPKVGYRLKVKNNSNKEITKLVILLYFYDKDGKIFFEEKSTLLDNNSYSTPESLKPNYSVLIPKSSNMIRTVDGIDFEEWDEGKVSFKIIELE